MFDKFLTNPKSYDFQLEFTYFEIGYDAIKKWLDENIIEENYKFGGTTHRYRLDETTKSIVSAGRYMVIMFTNEHDAILFKLKWL